MKYLVYIGTYTGEASRGIYLSRFDSVTGSLGEAAIAAEAPNPTFLALHPRIPVLYAAGRPTPDAAHGPREAAAESGTVSAFAVDRSGGLTLRNTRSSRGNGPCHLSLDPAGRFLLVANYHSGSIAVLPVEADGGLGEAVASIRHEGPAPAHAHWIQPDPSGSRVLVCDLGLDRVMVYAFDPATGALVPNDPPWTELAKGAGPRHLAFHPTGRFAYVINELDSTLAAFAYDAGRGALRRIQVLPTLPEGFSGKNATAEVQIHPSGRLLYGSNRGHDSIAVWAVDAESGRLEPVEIRAANGRTPRHIALDPSGRWLIAANEGSGILVVFRVDAMSGRLSPTGIERKAGTPVCVVYAPA